MTSLWSRAKDNPARYQRRWAGFPPELFRRSRRELIIGTTVMATTSEDSKENATVHACSLKSSPTSPWT